MNVKSRSQSTRIVIVVGNEQRRGVFVVVVEWFGLGFEIHKPENMTDLCSFVRPY